MRVLFSSTSGYGHVFPMVPLAQAFVAAGHHVRWATSKGAADLVAAAGLDVMPAGLSGPALGQAVQRVLGPAAAIPSAERAAFVFPRMFGEGLMPPMVADLLPLARGWRPDLMVHEQGELAGPLVAALLDVPCVTHSFGGAVPAPFVEDAGARLATVWSEHGLDIPPYAGCYSAAYLDICPPEVQSVPMDHIDGVQPLRPVPYTGPESADLPAYLADDPRPLVYLTLGTVNVHAPVLSAAVSALADLPVRLLVTVGPTGEPDALGVQPENVTVERFVPQTQVLPLCELVVSHAGSGTFLGALSLGLPQLCLPQAADQFRNAAGAIRAGVALVLPPDEATADTIAAAVQRLLVEESFRTAAARMSKTIAAMPAPADVVMVLEGLT
jgi:UDP:flavonoid glycosyltransferase YjiC (YdhE family)